MIFIAYFVLGFTLLQFGLALLNLIFIVRFNNDKKSVTDLVSVLIPARNEENNIINIVTDLQKQGVNNIEIIIFNDQSTDGTEKIINEMAQFDNRIKLLNSTGLPEGWLGKNFGCYTLANKAKGKYLLFIDADVRLSENCLANTISYLKFNNLRLVSVFPKQMMHSIGEKTVVPIMNKILLTLLPLFLVRHSGFTSLAAANGQFMLFDAQIYNQLQPHKKFKNEKVEDIKIARYYKNLKFKIACLSGINDISCRMYKNYSEAINGFSKNIVMFFGNSYLLAFMYWLTTTFGLIAIIEYFSFHIILLYIVFTFFTSISVSIVSHQSILQNIVLFIPHQINIGTLLFKSIWNKKTGNFEWKGRQIK